MRLRLEYLLALAIAPAFALPHPTIMRRDPPRPLQLDPLVANFPTHETSLTFRQSACDPITYKEVQYTTYARSRAPPPAYGFRIISVTISPNADRTRIYLAQSSVGKCLLVGHPFLEAYFTEGLSITGHAYYKR